MSVRFLHWIVVPFSRFAAINTQFIEMQQAGTLALRGGSIFIDRCVNAIAAQIGGAGAG